MLDGKSSTAESRRQRCCVPPSRFFVFCFCFPVVQRSHNSPSTQHLVTFMLPFAPFLLLSFPQIALHKVNPRSDISLPSFSPLSLLLCPLSCLSPLQPPRSSLHPFALTLTYICLYPALHCLIFPCTQPCAKVTLMLTFPFHIAFFPCLSLCRLTYMPTLTVPNTTFGSRHRRRATFTCALRLKTRAVFLVCHWRTSAAAKVRTELAQGNTEKRTQRSHEGKMQIIKTNSLSLLT